MTHVTRYVVRDTTSDGRLHPMRFALDPALRDQPCPHACVYFAGRIPCTGPLVCSQCGARDDDLPSEVRARVGR